MPEDNGGHERRDGDFSLNRRSALRAIGTASVAGGMSIAGLTGDASAATSYGNPVYEPVLADPSIIRTGDAYYAYGTEDLSTDWGGYCGESANTPIVQSNDLVNWSYVGQAFTNSGRPNWKEGGLWAPDVAYHDGRYLLYYSLSVWDDPDPGIGVATASSPEGPFTDHGKLFRSSEIGVGNSIDPFFVTEGGTPYLFWGSFHGIYGVELTADGLGWKPGTKFHVAGDAYEAPYVLKRNGYYYLFVSAGGCCEGHDSQYQLDLGRATSLFGPYYKRDGTDMRSIDQWGGAHPFLKGNDRFAGPGHNSIATDDAGNDWVVYHAYDRNDPETVCGGTPRRSLMVDRITWARGWPNLNDETPSRWDSFLPHESTYRPIPDGTYRLTNRHSGKALEVAGGEGATGNGENVQQWDYNGGDHQHWTFTHVGEGYYRVIARHSNRCLEVGGGEGATGNDEPVQQWDYLGGDHQHWKPIPVGDGYYALIAKHSQRGTDVHGWSTSNGGNVKQFDYLGGANQQWAFDPV